jgi:hypothetical protein
MDSFEQINQVVSSTFTLLGLEGFKGNCFPAAASIKGRPLMLNPKLKEGKFKDSVYFIFVDMKLHKIGKVGGGNRCLRRRMLDYRSTDPTGMALKSAIKDNREVFIVALNFKSKVKKIFGVETDGVIQGPSLEKALLKRAYDLNIPLPLNKNRG